MKILLVLLFLLFPLKTLAFENLIIVEVKVRGDSPDNSFVKIYNPTEKNLDISGFKLRKKSSTGREYSLRVFPNESFILSKNYFIWANSRDNYHLDIKADTYSTASISLNNSIALFSSEDNIIDALAWGDGENQFKKEKHFPYNPEKDQIIKRIKKEGLYKNTNNNLKDFYLFPKKEIEIQDGEIEKETLKKEGEFPLAEGFSLSVALAFLFLYLKKNLKYGRP